jgi:hypothetical protein
MLYLIVNAMIQPNPRHAVSRSRTLVCLLDLGKAPREMTSTTTRYGGRVHIYTQSRLTLPHESTVLLACRMVTNGANPSIQHSPHVLSERTSLFSRTERAFGYRKARPRDVHMPDGVQGEAGLLYVQLYAACPQRASTQCRLTDDSR